MMGLPLPGRVSMGPHLSLKEKPQMRGAARRLSHVSSVMGNPTRRGTVMIIVLGLITILLGLLLTMTVSVHQGLRSVYDYQANIQYFISDTLVSHPPP